MQDLRNNYDEIATVHNGTVYRKDQVVQVWWTHDILGRPFDNSLKASKTLFGNGRETWVFDNDKMGYGIAEAKGYFNSFVIDHATEDEGDKAARLRYEAKQAS